MFKDCLSALSDQFDNRVDDTLSRADKQTAMGSCVINGMSSEGGWIAIVVCRDEREFYAVNGYLIFGTERYSLILATYSEDVDRN